VVCTCPEWSSAEIFADLLTCSAVCSFQACGLYPWNPGNTDFLECIGGEKKLSINGPSRNSSRTTTYDMFVETVGSLLTAMQRSEKETMRQDLNSRDGLMH